VNEKQPRLVSITDAQAILGGISKPTVYSLVSRGELVKVKIGRRGLITTASLDAYIQRITEEAGAA